MKSLLSALFGAVLLSAGVATADAAKVYFSNTSAQEGFTPWEEVYSYAWYPQDVPDFKKLTAETIDGHELYCRELTEGQGEIIFLNKPNWNDQQQTANLEVKDGAVYNLQSALIANIVDGKYVEVAEIILPDENGLYLRGSFSGDWSCLPNYQFIHAGNIFQLTGVTLLKGTIFKLGSPDWGKYNYGGNAQVSVGGTYNLTWNSSDNLTAAEDLINVTLTFDESSHTLKVSDAGEPVTLKWFCAWDLQDGTGWHFGNEMTPQEGEPGVYKVVVETPENNEENYFAIFMGINNTDWNDEGTVRYIPEGGKTLDVDGDGTYLMQTGTDAAWKLTQKGQWTVSINVSYQSKSTITFDYGDSTGEANILIDDANDEDHSFKSYAMDEVEGTDDDYTWSGELNATDTVKFNIHGVNYWYDPSKVTSMNDDHTNGYLTIEYPLEEGDGTVTFDYTSNVTYVVNVTNKTVTLTLNNPPVVSMTVTSDEASLIHGLQAVSGETDMYELSHDLAVTSDDHIDFRIHGTRYECDYSSETAEDNFVLYKLVEADTDVEAPAVAQALVGETWNVRVSAKDGDKWVMFYKGDFPTAVNEIAVENGKATYFNMQGIQVSEPENGLYIVVKDGKAVKALK